jgi:hypothetical protein
MIVPTEGRHLRASPPTWSPANARRQTSHAASPWSDEVGASRRFPFAAMPPSSEHHKDTPLLSDPARAVRYGTTGIPARYNTGFWCVNTSGCDVAGIYWVG